MLGACHERVVRMLQLMERLQQHLLQHGWDDSVGSAAQDVMRYFDIAAPLHHEDEERHVFPPLLAGEDATMHMLVSRLQQDHRDMKDAWVLAREALATVVRAPLRDRDGFSPLQRLALTEFVRLYERHLREEDDLVYPAARKCLSPAAMQVMSADMMRRRGLEPG